MADVLDVAIGVSVLLVAAVCLFAPRRLVAALLFLVLGLLVTLVWARLDAPDVALAETALASGVTGALLVAAATEHPRSSSPRESRASIAVGLVLAGTLAAGLSAAFVHALRAGADSPRLGAEALDTVAQTPVSHPITAVLLDFRAYDTLLEIAVLTAAAVAALALHRAGRVDAVTLPTDHRPILTTLVRVLAPMLLIVAAYILVAGATRTGGAFQAGAILAGVLLTLLLSSEAGLTVTRRPLLPAAVFGLAVFLLTAFGTAAVGSGWLAMDEPWGATVILAVEAAFAVSIGVALAALFLAGFPDRAEEAPR